MAQGYRTLSTFGAVAQDSRPMSKAESTVWIIIEGAAAGNQADRDEFHTRYQPLIRACLWNRWRGGPFQREIEDAVQDVFLECFKPHGVLERADPKYPGGFRAFLRGVVCKVALRIEFRVASRPECQPDSEVLEEIVKAESS